MEAMTFLKKVMMACSGAHGCDVGTGRIPGANTNIVQYLSDSNDSAANITAPVPKPQVAWPGQGST